MFGVYIIIICAIFGLAYAVPTRYIEPLILPHGNSDQNIIVSASSNNLFQDSQTGGLEDKNTVVVSAYPVYHDVIRSPVLVSGDVVFSADPQTDLIQDAVEGALPMNDGLNNQDNVPVWKELEYVQSLQESDQVYDEQEPTKVMMDIDTDNYDDGDNALPNPVLPLESLPNIYSTYIHEAMPSLETRGSYDINVLNPENIEYLPPKIRPTRSSGEDFMRDLAHETIMNNIIPTMSFVRGAEEYPSYTPLQTAIYPRDASNGCGLPILLDCNPNLVRGSIASLYPEFIPPVASVLPIRGDQGSDIKEPLGYKSLNVHPFLHKQYSNQLA